MLASRPGGPVGVDPEVPLVDLHLVHDRVEEWDHLEGGEGGLPLGLLVERRDPDQAVDAAFALEEAVGVAAPDHELHGADPRFGALRYRLHHQVEAPPVGPPAVHAQQDLSPVLGVGAAGSGLNVADGITLVVLAREQRPDLQGVEPGGQVGDSVGDLAVQALVALLGRHLRQSLGVLQALRQV